MNHLSKIRFQNFRNFKERQTIRLRPITLIYGANSAGKSSVVKALRWLRDIRDSSLAKTVAQHLPNQDSRQEIEMGFEFRPDEAGQFSVGHGVKAFGGDLASVGIIFKVETSERLLARAPEYVKNAQSLMIRFPAYVTSLELSVNDEILVRFQIQFFDPRILELGSLGCWGGGFVLPIEFLNTEHALMKAFAEVILVNARAALDRFPMREHTEVPRECVEMLDAVRREASAANSQQVIDIIRECAEENEILATQNLGCTAEDVGSGVGVWTSLLEPELQLRFPIPRTFNEFLKQIVGQACAKWFNELLNPTELNAGNDPIGDCDFVHVPSLRENPKGPFEVRRFTERRSMPLGWPSCTRNDLDRVNAWLCELAKFRPEANFEIDYEEFWEQRRTREGEERSDSALRITGVRDKRRGITLPFDQVGTGVSQLVPVLLGALSNEEALVVIEQPELHLHPALQSELGDLLISASVARDGGELCPNQFIVETHSEHLLLRLMRRIRQTSNGSLENESLALRPDDVQVLFVEDRGEESVIHEMPLSNDGELIRDWPGGFFEEGLREVLM